MGKGKNNNTNGAEKVEKDKYCPSLVTHVSVSSAANASYLAAASLTAELQEVLVPRTCHVMLNGQTVKPEQHKAISAAQGVTLVESSLKMGTTALTLQRLDCWCGCAKIYLPTRSVECFTPLDAVTVQK